MASRRPGAGPGYAREPCRPAQARRLGAPFAYMRAPGAKGCAATPVKWIARSLAPTHRDGPHSIPDLARKEDVYQRVKQSNENLACSSKSGNVLPTPLRPSTT